MKYKYSHILFVAIILMGIPLVQAMKPVACTGVSKKCTKDIRFDKTIEGQVYSCYECKQTVCKSGGSGPIAGTETSTVCESQAPTGRALIRSNQELQFDEADAVFGRRSEVKGAPSNTSETAHSKTYRVHKLKIPSGHATISDTINSRKSESKDSVQKKSNRSQTIDHRKTMRVKKKPERGTKRPMTNKVAAPTKVTLYAVTNHQLSISWMDNANNEYGVSVERGIPHNDRGGINYNWQHVFNVEERIDANIKGSGWRSDGDDGLASGTEYCYRLRAYRKSDYSEYSRPVCVTSN